MIGPRAVVRRARVSVRDQVLIECHRGQMGNAAALCKLRCGDARPEPDARLTALQQFLQMHRRLIEHRRQGGAGVWTVKRFFALLLGGVERGVGGSDQPRRKGADRRRPLRHADRSRNGDFGAAAVVGIGAASPQHAARDRRGFGQRGSGQHDAELVAAGARQHVAGPQAVQRGIGEPAQAVVAAGVAMTVIDLFETIEIDGQERERLARPQRQRALLAAVAAAGGAGWPPR